MPSKNWRTEKRNHQPTKKTFKLICFTPLDKRPNHKSSLNFIDHKRSAACQPAKTFLLYSMKFIYFLILASTLSGKHFPTSYYALHIGHSLSRRPGKLPGPRAEEARTIILFLSYCHIFASLTMLRCLLDQPPTVSRPCLVRRLNHRATDAVGNVA